MPLKKMPGLTIRQLIHSTKDLSDGQHQNIEIASSRFIHSKVLNGKLAPGTFYAITNTHEGHQVRQHEVKVWEKTPKGEKLSDPNKFVQVSCSCARHTYMWEYALTYHNASIIEYSNGEPPLEKNPNYYFGCCKHVFRVLQEILRRKF